MSLAGDRKLNIILFGAHPDDPEKLGGIMLRFIQQGHNVCLVSLANGNAGPHFFVSPQLTDLLS